MANYAERINNEDDIHIQSQMTAKDWAAQNANGIIGDDTTGAPNINYTGLMQMPAANQWQDSVASSIYIGDVVEYIGSRPNDR